MRLIDADKLPYVNKVILVDDVDGDITITVAKEHTSYVNDETPTVDAIPVEWLKQWEEKHKNDPCYRMFVSEEILADWEKENE